MLLFMFLFTGKILELFGAIFVLISKFWMLLFDMNVQVFYQLKHLATDWAFHCPFPWPSMRYPINVNI